MKEETRKHTSVQTLWEETPVQERRRMLGVRVEQSIAPKQLEINQEHLKVRGAHDRHQDMATRRSVDE